MLCRANNFSDSSSSFLSEEDNSPKRKKLKKDHVEDRATSKFYTKDESQEYLPYVANNDIKNKKTKKKKYKKKSLFSKNQSFNKVNINLQCLLLLLQNYLKIFYEFQLSETQNDVKDIKDIKYVSNYAPNDHEQSYLNNPAAFMKSDVNKSI